MTRPQATGERATPTIAEPAGARAGARARTARVQRVYKLVAPGYDAFRRLWGRWTKDVERTLDRLYEERIGRESRILELAPGTGVNILRLRRQAPSFRSYLGLDASESMLERARARAAEDRRIELRLADVCDLADVPGPFDFIVSTWLLSHLEDPASVVEEALRRLAPGGTAVFVFSSPPRAAWLRRLLAPAYRWAAARFVDPATLEALPFLERISTSAAGIATVAVFRAPGDARETPGASGTD